MTGTTIHLTLNGLSTTSRAESWALLAMGGGQWELEFPLPAESQVQEFTPDLEFQVGDKTAILETVHCLPWRCGLLLPVRMGHLPGSTPLWRTLIAHGVMKIRPFLS